MAEENRWEQLYMQSPPSDIPFHFDNIKNSQFQLEYLKAILNLTPRSATTCETGIGTGFGAIWLSLRGVQASGIDIVSSVVERAKYANSLLKGHASFEVGDLFKMRNTTPTGTGPRYRVIHHQGVLEHFTVKQMHAALAVQVMSADYVVFSVPSCFYLYEPEYGNEKLLPVEEWEHHLKPFDIHELRYYGDEQAKGRDHILCILKGEPESNKLTQLIDDKDKDYIPGISAIVHTRNEEKRLPACLDTLTGWTDEIIICDMESSDETVNIASKYTQDIISHPLISNFDRARNVSAMRARYQWIFYLDADERVPEQLGSALRNMISSNDATFAAVLPPFKHHFLGYWLQSLYPGYTAPRLLKNGHFYFNARLHSGAVVDGTTIAFPPNNPDLALIHYSYDSISHYIDKMNRYTNGEAENLFRDGKPFHWKHAISAFIGDMTHYYDTGNGKQDGIIGWIWAFNSAFYRFTQYTKLLEMRAAREVMTSAESVAPNSIRDVLEYALATLDHPNVQKETKANLIIEPNGSDILWIGPIYDASGLGEESRSFILSLERAGVNFSVGNTEWGQGAYIDPELKSILEKRLNKPVCPGYIQIIQDFPANFKREVHAGYVICRTMFETDRYPDEWIDPCNAMDEVWVPSEFNVKTLAAAGVKQNKLQILPGCLATEPYNAPSHLAFPWSADSTHHSKTVFMTIFDWTLHKGWDVLLKAFIQEFGAEENVLLVIKIWSSLGYSHAEIQQQAAEYIRDTCNIELSTHSNIQFIFEHFESEKLIQLYKSVDCFVLPSRGEGWGRPFMEAMACGIPVIGSDWGGNTHFMKHDNSLLIKTSIKTIPERGWREIPFYRGHCWCEPDTTDLRDKMRMIFEKSEKVNQLAMKAKEDITSQYSIEHIGAFLRSRLEHIQIKKDANMDIKPRQVFNKDIATDTSISTLDHTVPTKIKKGNRIQANHKPEISVQWEGDFFQWHSLAHVNRELCIGLLKNNIELSIVNLKPPEFSPGNNAEYNVLAETQFKALSHPHKFTIRHHFPPRFDKPENGQLIVIQPWEYGYLPEAWIQPIKDNVDQIWCYSQYVRDVYTASGIPEAMTRVVPLGVDSEIFHPDAPEYQFTNEPGAGRLLETIAEGRDPFVFLFVGGTLHRKGIDILLDAYVKSFSAFNDVVLVIKDTGTQTVYKGQNSQAKILELCDDPTRPMIVYLDKDMRPHQLAGLYTAADCLVQPYRGEGFCLPALEAISSGIPVIVPDGGPTDDFIDGEVGWRLPAEMKQMEGDSVGPWKCCGPIWQFEVTQHQLASTMHQVFINPPEAKKRGANGRKRVEKQWSWEQTTKIATEHLESISTKAVNTKHKTQVSGNHKKSINAVNTSPLAGTLKRDAEISLCMIVRNEERCLKECLDSIKPWVDEMIVVDTGSTDRTIQIAKEAGALIYSFPWCDDFSAARNESLKFATKDWILWMDADDTILPTCGKLLKSTILTAEDQTNGFIMQVHIPPAPGKSGMTIVDHLKLFRNIPGIQFEGRIHEQILESLNRIGGKVERSELYVIHSGYDYSEEGQKRKRERDLTILEKDLHDRPGHPFVLFNIGMTAFYMGNWPQAIEALTESLARSRSQDSIVRKVYAMLAGSYLELGDIHAAIYHIEEGLKLFPFDPEINFRASTIYLQANKLEAAENCLKIVLSKRDTGHIDSLDISITSYKAHHNLALVYMKLNQPILEEQQWRSALAICPDFLPSMQGLQTLLERQGRYSESNQIIQQIQSIENTDYKAT